MMPSEKSTSAIRIESTFKKKRPGTRPSTSWSPPSSHFLLPYKIVTKCDLICGFIFCTGYPVPSNHHQKYTVQDDKRSSINIYGQDRDYLQEETTWHAPQYIMIPSTILLPLTIQDRYKNATSCADLFFA